MAKRTLILIVLVAAAGVAWAVFDHSRIKGESPPAQANSTKSTTAAPNVVTAQKPEHVTPESAVAKDLRTQFKEASDYAAFADTLREAAQAGDPKAQYLLAEALRYCQQNLSRFFLVTGKPPRTLDEAQQRWASRPAGYQQEIVEIYTRCHQFLDDAQRRAQLDEWRAWLDDASTEGYSACGSHESRSDAFRCSRCGRQQGP
jgi:hypothetical protein